MAIKKCALIINTGYSKIYGKNIRAGNMKNLVVDYQRCPSAVCFDTQKNKMLENYGIRIPPLGGMFGRGLCVHAPPQHNSDCVWIYRRHHPMPRIGHVPVSRHGGAVQRNRPAED